MKLFFRLFWLIVTQSRRSRCALFGPCDTHFRVLPNDLDVLGHVNNGVYLTMMDLARTDLLLRSDTFHAVRNNGWYPVLAGETIRFKRSLKLGQRFFIRTKVVGWDTQSVYLEQLFIRNNEFIARAVVDARFLSKKGGKVTPQELLEFLQIDPETPSMPEWVQLWIESQRKVPIEVS